MKMNYLLTEKIINIFLKKEKAQKEGKVFAQRNYPLLSAASISSKARAACA